MGEGERRDSKAGGKDRGVVNILHKPWRNIRFLNYVCTTIITTIFNWY